MDFSAFSHGQIQSKLWLCQELEQLITHPVNVAILGSWCNILGFMLLVRNQNLYNQVHGIDSSIDSVNLANKICDAWMINNDQKVKNFCRDVNNLNFDDYDVIICTSIEDIQNSGWYDRIPNNKLVCIQTLDLTQQQVDKYKNWKIVNPNPSIEIFKKKYPISNILYEGSKFFDYIDLKYNRFMLIGYK